MVNVPTPWPLTATRTSLPTDTVRVPWTTGGGDEAGAGAEDEDEDEDEEDDAGDEAGAVADEEDPDDDEPGAEVAEREVPGAAAWEPGPVARTAGTVAPPGLTDGAGPRPPAPGVWPVPSDGPPRELPTTPGPALPRAPAPGA